jgi:hypothetical protein
VPLRESICGLPVALSVTESVPPKVPEAVGAKVTLTVQFAPGARVGPQVLLCPKFALAAILAMLSVAVPEFVSVTGRGWLVMPTTSVPKVKLVVEKETFGEPPPNSPPPQPLSRQDPKSTSAKCFFILPPLRADWGPARGGSTDLIRTGAHRTQRAWGHPDGSNCGSGIPFDLVFPAPARCGCRTWASLFERFGSDFAPDRQVGSMACV